ncbi:MAG: cob(I)yrinic acid a,c-diamide adenosyltransferase [Gemmatimonadota bacterium]
MKIYTRRGDQGLTDLFGGARVPKDDARVEAYGAVDELNAALGLALAMDEDDQGGGHLDAERLARVQEDLFTIGSRLAAVDPEEATERGTIPPLDDSRVEDLEAWIDELDRELPELDAFVLPGGSRAGAQLHVARTVCRRAERAVTRLRDARPDLEEEVLPYVNRLSDLLFTLARAVNRRAGSRERRWTPQRERREEGADS